VQYSELVDDNVPRGSALDILSKLNKQAEYWFSNLMDTNNTGTSWSGKINCHSFVYHILTKEIQGLDAKEKILDKLKGAKPEYQCCVDAYLTLFDCAMRITDPTVANCVDKTRDGWEFV
jgi:hypothetical protein